MKVYSDLIKNYVDIENYTSSKGFLGYFERIGIFNYDICQTAVDLFFDAFKLFDTKFQLITSLRLLDDIDSLKKEYEISGNYIENYLKPLINEKIISVINYNELEFNYNSDKYFSMIKKLDENFIIRDSVSITIDILKKTFFTVMALDGIMGHCFIIIEDKKLIAYPHDDIGFGFISMGKNEEILRKYIKDKFDSKKFSIHLS